MDVDQSPDETARRDAARIRMRRRTALAARGG